MITAIAGVLEENIWAYETDNESVELLPEVSFSVMCTQMYAWQDQGRIAPDLSVSVFCGHRFVTIPASVMAKLYEIGVV